MSNFITRVLFVLRKYFFRFVLFSIVTVLVFCIYSYSSSYKSASAILAFTYPNASEGLYPNGTYFNAYNILTNDIVENAISKAGLKGVLNSRKVLDEVTIRPRSNASLITTQFIISYSQGKDDRLGAVGADGLLQLIIYSYIDHFHAIYSNDQLVLNLDLFDQENLEYIDYIKYYNMTLNQLQKYLRAQQDNNKDFVSADGTSFQDLLNIIERYRITSLKGINSIISERGVTRNRNVYLDRLKYRMWKLKNNYEYNRSMHQLYKTILQDYESRLTSVVFVPSLDSSRKFYMSKTKVGLDIYSLNATNYEETAEEIQRQINQANQNSLRISDAENTSMTSENTQRVNEAIATLRKQLDATMNKVRLVEKEFSQYKNHNYVTMRPLEPSFMERTQAKKAVMLAGVLDAVLVIVLAVGKQNKKGKKSK